MYFSNKTDKTKIIDLQNEIVSLKKQLEEKDSSQSVSLLTEEILLLKKENEDLKSKLASLVATQEQEQKEHIDLFENQVETTLESESSEEVLEEESLETDETSSTDSEIKPKKRGRQKKS